MKLSDEHRNALDALSSATRLFKLFDTDLDYTSFVREVSSIKPVCPQRFRRALALGRMLVETGVLVPDGHGANIVFEAMTLVNDHRDYFDTVFALTSGCPGCTEDE